MSTGFGVNDTVALMMRLLNNHQEIFRLWHEVSALLQRLGLITPAAATPAKATHAFDVKWVQTALNKQMMANLKVDGALGPETLKMVQAYQKKRGLTPDGWPGPLTLATLEKDMGP